MSEIFTQEAISPDRAVEMVGKMGIEDAFHAIYEVWLERHMELVAAIESARRMLIDVGLHGTKLEVLPELQEKSFETFKGDVAYVDTDIEDPHVLTGVLHAAVEKAHSFAVNDGVFGGIVVFRLAADERMQSRGGNLFIKRDDYYRRNTSTTEFARDSERTEIERCFNFTQTNRDVRGEEGRFCARRGILRMTPERFEERKLGYLESTDVLPYESTVTDFGFMMLLRRFMTQDLVGKVVQLARES